MLDLKFLEMMDYKSKFSFFCKFLREIRGLSYLIEHRARNYFQKNYVFKSDLSKNKLTQKKGESFSDFFMRVEKVRYAHIRDKRISKNVQTIDQAISGSRWWISKMEDYCELSTNSFVLDFGCGGLRLGSGLIDYLNEKHYTGLDIKDDFYKEAISKMPNIKNLLKKSPNFGLTSDSENLYPLNDIAVSTLVVAHIPKDELTFFFKNINKRLKHSGYLIFDFVPCIFNMKLNATSFAYRYKVIEEALFKAGFVPYKFFGWAIVALKK